MITQEELCSIIRENRIFDDTGATFIIIYRAQNEAYIRE